MTELVLTQLVVPWAEAFRTPAGDVWRWTDDLDRLVMNRFRAEVRAVLVSLNGFGTQEVSKKYAGNSRETFKDGF